MMNVKSATQSWPSSQTPDLKAEGSQTMSATDRDKVLGNESLGDVLNRVADPNYVDTTKKMRSVGNSELGKDAFMTLLLTQMKNQDPTTPLKSHEMAAQLAQFTTLEKLSNINEGIGALHKDQQPAHNLQALSFIGKTITTDNSKVSRTEKEGHHEIRFSLPSDAPKLTMQVKNSDGKLVRTMEFKNLKSGRNELTWNGMTDDATAAPTGDYTVSFEAVGSNGHKLQVETKTEGQISGVNFTPHGPELMVGKQVIDMSEVKSISDPAIHQGKAEVAAPVQGLPTMEQKLPDNAPQATGKNFPIAPSAADAKATGTQPATKNGMDT